MSHFLEMHKPIEVRRILPNRNVVITRTAPIEVVMKPTGVQMGDVINCQTLVIRGLIEKVGAMDELLGKILGVAEEAVSNGSENR